ncbi:MAG: hypothetical protein KBT03_03825 [Bacteroidales bacterium]|nr:hypothetical protein [Candidatus Scybalousia scybalohippi]
MYFFGNENCRMVLGGEWMLIDLAWWIFDNIPLGKLAPWYFGLLIGRMPHKIYDVENETNNCNQLY